MKKLVLMALLLCSTIAFAQPSVDQIKAAQEDWDQRFVPLFNYSGCVNNGSMGYDVDKPGVMVSWQRTDGVIEQYGASMSPLEYYNGVLMGGSGE
jgi:hypothetical protein